MINVNYCVCCGHKLNMEISMGKSDSECPNCRAHFDIYCSETDFDIIAYYPDNIDNTENNDIVA